MGETPITQGQKQYIERLCGRLGYSFQFAISEALGTTKTPLHQLTVKEASELIDWLVEEKDKSWR